ncbi:MAG: beta-eliminating lyase-related protein [Bacteroidales bacterium]
MKSNKQNNRREFLKNCGLLTAPFLIPASGVAALSNPVGNGKSKKNSIEVPVNFIWDGFFFTPEKYIEKLAEINEINPIEHDYYGKGGPTELLEIEFAKATGKEKAIYFPSGSMANQVAMKMLNEDKTKVIVPENSHIFRDEGDAAQSVHELRLIPLGKDKSYYDLEDLKSAIDYSDKGFHYDSGLGTIVIENPVRRVQNRYVPFETIKKISNFCRENGYKLHLDGARLHIASAYSGVSVAEYASHFDTVYISLYKYLNAGGGAILCGDAELIDRMAHQIKILGGSILRNWSVTAMALHYLPGIENRWEQVVEKAKQLIPELNKINGLFISSLENGTNSYKMELSADIDPALISEYLLEQNIIWVARIRDAGDYFFVVNESLLSIDISEAANAWETAIEQASK